MSRSVTTWVASAAILLSAATAGFCQDSVKLDNGKTQNVKITAADFDALRYAVPNGNASLKWNTVVSFELSGVPNLYKAEDSFANGDPKSAIALLKPIVDDAKARPVARQEALHQLAAAHLLTGDLAAAIEVLTLSLKEFPKGRHLMTDGTSLISCLLAKKEVGTAARAIDDMRSKVGTGDPSMKAGVDVLWGRVLLEQGKLSEAQSAFEGAAATGGIRDETKTAARLGVARCLLKADKGKDAETKFREILAEKAAPNEALSEAWNGLGDIAIARGRKDKDGVRNALFCYLRTIVLYAPRPTEPTEEFERSLAGASEAFRAMSDLEPDAEKKKALLEKSRQHAQELKNRFPFSRYVREG